MPFDQKQLRTFLAIIDHGSLGRASEVLNMGQPNISRLIADMERRLGQPLFERNAKGMLPTAAGATLAPRARQLVFDLQEARDALDALRGLRRGTARIAATSALARHVLPAVIKQFTDNLPGLRVFLMEGVTDKMLGALHRREIELLLGTALPADPEISVIGRLKYHYAYTPFCAAGHPAFQDNRPSLDAVFAERWALGLPGTLPRTIFDLAVGQSGHPTEPEIAVETDSVDAIVKIVADTNLVGWLPSISYREAEFSGKVRGLDVPELTLNRQFFVYRRRRGELPAAAAQLLKLLPLMSGEEEML
jgi:DNA-binding transcriptional LysR family regulator